MASDVPPTVPVQKNTADTTRGTFDALYRRTYRLVHSFAYRMVGTHAEADDLAQEAYVRAWRSFANYNQERSFERWILRIVTNLAVDRLRSARRHPTCSLAAFGADGDPFAQTDIATDPERIVLSREVDVRIRAAIDELPAVPRRALLLADVGDYSYEEIASMTDCPIGTVRSRLHRARRSVRVALKRSGYPHGLTATRSSSDRPAQ